MTELDRVQHLQFKNELNIEFIQHLIFIVVPRTSILVTSDIAKQSQKVVSIFLIIQVVLNFFNVILPRWTSLILGDEEYKKKKLKVLKKVGPNR